MGEVATPPAISVPLNRQRAGRWFYIGTALIAILTVIAGFGPSLINTATRNGPVTPIVLWHAFFSLSWLLIFLVQASLIRKRRVALHRRLGAVSALVAVAVMVTGYMTILEMTRRGFDLSGDLAFKSHTLSLGPLSNLIAFGVLVAAGYWNRGQGEIHKRLMVLAINGGLMPAPLAHVFGHSAALRGEGALFLFTVMVFLFAGAAYDRYASGHFCRVSLLGGIAILIWDAAAIAVGRSATWHQFSAWLLR